MPLYPVAIITYNRPLHTKKVIESLAKNTLAKKTDVFIFSDAPKIKEHEKNVNELRTYLDSLESLQYFKSLTVIKAEQNEHVFKATLKAGNMLLENHEAFIGLEDDIETHPFFLQYMNDTLNYYKEDKSKMAVIGYSHQQAFKFALKAICYKKELLLSYAFHAYGWAIWKDRWRNIDWEMKDYHLYNKSLFKKIKNIILSWNHLLAVKKEYKNPSKNLLWDIRMSYNMCMQNKSCIWPRYSYTSNIGFDGSGFHQWNFASRFFETPLNKAKEHVQLDPFLKLSFWVSFMVTITVSIKWIITFFDLFIRKTFGFLWRIITLKFFFKKD